MSDKIPVQKRSPKQVPSADSHRLRPLISLRNASIRFGNRTIFPDTTFAIMPGEQWMVYGENCSGKSLFVRALCGDLVVNGELDYCFDGDDDPDITAKIAFVSCEDRRSLLSDENRFVQARYLSCDESITVSRFLAHDRVHDINPYEVGARRESPAAYAMLLRKTGNLLDLDGLMTRNIDQLSNGESRRVLIAAALLRRPSLLFIEAPFQGVDMQHRAMLCAAFSTLAAEGMHLVIVTANSDDTFPGMTRRATVENFRLVRVEPLRPSVAGRKLQPAEKHGMDITLPLFYSKRRVYPVPVSMKNVTVRYGDTVLLDAVDWEVHAGEHWVITGENGAGKSTLLSLISCANPQAYSNDVSVFGKRYGTGRPVYEVRRLTGTVSPELQACFPLDCTCINAVCSGFSGSMGFAPGCGTAKRRRAQAWLQSFGIGDKASSVLSSLSEADLRLVLIARALINEPSLLMFDEPCQGLDARHRRQILSVIERVADRGGVTILYITHDRHELPRCITHRLELRKGKIVRKGAVGKGRRSGM